MLIINIIMDLELGMSCQYIAFMTKGFTCVFSVMQSSWEWGEGTPYGDFREDSARKGCLFSAHSILKGRVFGNIFKVPDSSVKQADVSAVGANMIAEGTNF